MAQAPKPPTDPSELKIALDNRAFEIQLFWQRSNYFLVLMTALGIGVFSVKDVWFSPVIAAFATAASWFWFRTNLGSKFWQESWEVEVTELSREHGVRSFEKSIKEVTAQVAASFGLGNPSDRRSWFRRWVDKQTVKKPSVTYNMILLSLLATIVWAAVTVTFTGRLMSHICDIKDEGLVCLQTSEQRSAQPNVAASNTAETALP